MSKIKGLQEFFVGQRWIYHTFNSIAVWTEKVAKLGKRKYFELYIKREVAKKNYPEKSLMSVLVPVLAHNGLTSALEMKGHDMTKLVIDITMSATEKAYSDIAKIVGVQPLNGTPVGLVYALEWKSAEPAPNEEVSTTPEAALFPEGGGSIPGFGGRKMTLEYTAKAVQAMSRKLNAAFTVEVMQDLKTMHGVSIESELVKGFSAEIAYELVSEVLADLVEHAEDSSTFILSTNPTTNLSLSISQAANEIARRTRRGPGNFIVCSPLVVSALQAAPHAVFAPPTKDQQEKPYSTELTFCGTLNGAIKVYMSLSMGDKILVGYKGGNGEADTGHVVTPYVLACPTGIVMNPISFQPVCGMITRSGKYWAEEPSAYYRILKISGLEFV